MIKSVTIRYGYEGGKQIFVGDFFGSAEEVLRKMAALTKRGVVISTIQIKEAK